VDVFLRSIESELKLAKPKAANLLKTMTLSKAGGLSVGVALSASAAYAYGGQNGPVMPTSGSLKPAAIALQVHDGKT
jgi:hypothetical protein